LGIAWIVAISAGVPVGVVLCHPVQEARARLRQNYLPAQQDHGATAPELIAKAFIVAAKAFCSMRQSESTKQFQ
jgi:hypothetical protein